MKLSIHSLLSSIAIVGVASTGCTSIRSSFYNTATGCDECGQPHYRGVPTTIEVSRWIKLEVVERRYLDQSATVLVADQNKTGYSRDFVSRMVNYDFIKKKELFTVDPKRPLAGTLAYAFGFGGSTDTDPDKQNITNYSYDVDDKTIEVVSKAVTNMISRVNAINAKAASQGAGAAPPAIPAEITEITTTVAIEFFDLAQPGVELKVQHFLETHVNRCDPCNKMPVAK
ncbi:MAG TPA: hypothetical protein PLX97_09265 [Gemmatales bacterium]|nr:hypothetical protein [Gemmatales bacterium]